MTKIIGFIFSIFETLLTAIMDGLVSLGGSLASKGHKNEYSAEFVSPGTVLSRFNFGFSLAGGLRATTRDVATKNCLIVGPSGSGKTSTVLVGSIFTLSRGGASMCIMDVSGELFKLTSGYLHKKGYKIYCINFGNASDSFNFLLLCNDVTEIQKCAFLLIKNSGIESKNDPYWSSSAELMLAFFMEYMRFFTPEDYCTVSNLVTLIDTYAGNVVHVDKIIVKTGNKELIARYKAMNAVSEKTLQSTLATVRTALKVFGTPALRKCTATNTIDFSSFRTVKSVLFICTPLNDVDFYAPVSALLFSAMFNEILSRIPDTKTELYIYCLIDEMATMRFQNLALVFANCRKYAAGCMGVIQDEQMLQITMTLAEAHGLKSNCHSKVYLPGQPLSTCTQLQENLGKYSYRDEKTNGEKVRWLKTASEIRMSDKAIILVGNLPPIEAKLVSFYKHSRMKRWAQIPPYVLEPKAIQQPPLLPL